MSPNPNGELGDPDSEAIKPAMERSLSSTSRRRLLESVMYRKPLKEISRKPKIRTYQSVSLKRRLLKCTQFPFMR
jgi:hypothetical protein